MCIRDRVKERIENEPKSMMEFIEEEMEKDEDNQNKKREKKILLN